MGEAEHQDSMQISEDLKFVTACLIGRNVRVQTRAILLNGTLKAANLDKDYGIVLQLSAAQIIKMFLRDIVSITAENVPLELDKDAILKSCLKENQSEVVTDKVQSSAGQSGEDTKASEQHATSSASSTNTVPDQQLHHPLEKNTNTVVLNATSMASGTITGIDQTPMMPITQPAQTDNIVQGVPPVGIPIAYHGIAWQYPDAQGQLVPYVPPYQTFVPPQYPQAAQPFQGYVPHQGPGYGHQPQYLPQNFDPSYQAPGRYRSPR